MAQRPAIDELPSLIPPGFNWRLPDYEPIWRERKRRLDNIRAHPEILPGLLEVYANDAVQFISDWGCTTDPRNIEVGLPVTVPFLLFPKQEDFITWCYDRWTQRESGIIEKSRDSGATWLAVSFSVWMWRFRPGAVAGFGSRKEEYVDNIDDPKSIFWKVRKFIELTPREFRPPGYDPRRHAPFMRVINPDPKAEGATIVGEAGENIGRGNRTSIYFVDEAAYIERPQLMEAALSETSNCKLYCSTPNEPGDWFHRKRMSKTLPVFTFHWRDDPRKGEEWYAKKKETLDAVIVAKEIDINYEGSVLNALIPGNLVDAAMARGPAQVNASGPYFLSIDVARYGPNETVITVRRGRVVFPQIIRKRIDTEDSAGEVIKIVADYGGIAKFGAIGVDDTGVGGGVTDKLRRMGRAWYRKVQPVIAANTCEDDAGNFNVRAQMYSNLLAWLKDQPVSLPNDPELKVQLLSIKYRYRSGKRLILSKKEKDTEDMAKSAASGSPDRADSLAINHALIPVTDVDDDGDGYVPPRRKFDRGAGY